MRRKLEIYHPTIVMIDAMGNEIRPKFLISRTIFAAIAITSDTALIAIILKWSLAISEIDDGLQSESYQLGSATSVPTASVELDDLSRTTLQSMIRAHRLNIDATGPNVPAMSGKSVEENHHLLEGMCQPWLHLLLVE